MFWCFWRGHLAPIWSVLSLNMYSTMKYLTYGQVCPQVCCAAHHSLELFWALSQLEILVLNIPQHGSSIRRWLLVLHLLELPYSEFWMFASPGERSAIFKVALFFLGRVGQLRVGRQNLGGVGRNLGGPLNSLYFSKSKKISRLRRAKFFPKTYQKLRGLQEKILKEHISR